MLSRRQFLFGLGALTASAVVGIGWGSTRVFPKDITEPEIIPPTLDCDWILDNISIIDGSGEASFRGRVAVKGEHIVEIGNFPTPQDVRVIDGQGLSLSPGFIDLHTHTENYIYSGESVSPILSQGVTTQIGGNCGNSPRNGPDFIKTLPPLGINFGMLVGYGALRELAKGGRKNGKVTAQELDKMKEHLVANMEAGALGMSIGLEYWPQNYASTEEIMELCQVVKDYGGFYATHIRSEYNDVLPALEEAIEIGSKVGIPVQYSHIKAGHSNNWPKFPRILEMLQEAKAAGVDITADVYAYTFSSTDLGQKPFRHSISQENLEAAVVHPQVFFGSDSGLYKGGRANHPRAYGNYPRFLSQMVRERRVLPLEMAVKKMTSDPAGRLLMKDRGLLRAGYKADMVLFDPDSIVDKATIGNPSLYSEGIRQVWVNGELSWSEGSDLKKTTGQLISYI